MYYVIERSDMLHLKFLVVNFKAMRETPWSYSIDDALQRGLIDQICTTSIEDRIDGLTCATYYGPLTSLPTRQSYPELFI